jgi:diaminohydroxyphosphoribosylaminopyrimidine deaminase / 5-amino-6-(5-phosphoribosylamino)uracil reductase
LFAAVNISPDELFMRRCIQLAQLGAGWVAPNPMVGAVLVYQGRIIGEGYHRQYGQPHAEVNCFDAVAEADRHLIRESVLYVSLEPCSHYGKTPPCADRIIREGVQQVVIGSTDPNPQVNGKGIEKLQQAGITVTTGILEAECLSLNKRFFTCHTYQRPWVLLKWAATGDGYIGTTVGTRVLISNDYVNRLVHRWRSEEAAIFIGTNTAAQDNPALTNRLWTGNHPVRLVLDRNLRLPASLQLFNREVKTVVFNTTIHDLAGNILYYRLDHAEEWIPQVLTALHQLNIQSVMVEGGAGILQQFINAGIWDEARVIQNSALVITDKAYGVKAPVLHGAVLQKEDSILTDTIFYYSRVPDVP